MSEHDTFRPNDPRSIPFGEHRRYHVAWYKHAEGRHPFDMSTAEPWIHVFATDSIQRVFAFAWAEVKARNGEIEIPALYRNIFETIAPGETVFYIRSAYVQAFWVERVDQGIEDL